MYAATPDIQVALSPNESRPGNQPKIFRHAPTHAIVSPSISQLQARALAEPLKKKKAKNLFHLEAGIARLTRLPIVSRSLIATNIAAMKTIEFNTIQMSRGS